MHSVNDATASFPPAGFVDRHEAARMFGMSPDRWRVWERRGRVGGGRLVPMPGTGTRVKLYAVDDLRRQLKEFRTEPVFPPEGFVDRHEAARILGMSTRTLSTWEHAGRVSCGQMVSVPGKPGIVKIYPIHALRQLSGQFEATREALKSEPFPPPGFVTREQTCQIIGIKIRTLCTWEGEGRFKGGVLSQIPGKPGRRTLYPIEEINRLAEEHRQLNALPEPFPDPTQPGCWRVPVCSDKHNGVEALIDAADVPLVRGKRWNLTPGKNGNELSGGSVVLSAHGRSMPALTRILLGITDPAQLVCHLNEDRLDCRRENLVVRTRSQVKAASRKAMIKGGRVCSSRFKGVHWQADGRKWSATIALSGKIRPLGRFISEIDAALAYDAAAWEIYGEHARLNFDDPAEAQRLRALQPPVEPGAFPPPGRVDPEGACQMFNIPLATWTAWEEQGRMPLAGDHIATPEGDECTLYEIEALNVVQSQIRALVKPYPDPERPGCYRVPLMSHLCYREAIVDEQSLPLVEGRGWHWQARHDGSGAGFVGISAQHGPHTALARVVAEVLDAGIDVRVSHRNGDPLDCRRSNLVVRSMQQQMFGNRKMGTVNGRKYTSKFKGVCWDKRAEKWLAVIGRDGRSRRLGAFHSELSAAQAYDEAARELFGEYARPNFPDGIDAWLEQEAEALQAEAAETKQREAA